MSSRLCGLVLGAALIGIPACGGSTDTEAEPVSEAEFAERAASAYCEHIGPCCEQSQYAYDAGACKVGLEGFLDRAIELAHSLGGIAFDSSAAGRCVAWLGHSACAGEDSDACERVWIGTKPAGAACTSGSQCARPPGGDSECRKDGAAQGVCVDTPPDPCVGDALCDGKVDSFVDERSCVGDQPS